MNIKNLLSSFAIATLALTTISANAGNITANAARNAANNFLKQKMLKSPGSFNAAATADLRLVHAEPSAVVAGANDFYAFNIKGGGFVIIAGEDRAAQVLGYSDKGRLDFNNLPLPLIDLLDGYKREIEFLQTYEGNDLIPAPASFKASGTVGPLIKTTWGQEDPYDWQCPVYQGEYCVVGCVATAMAQVLKYWEYPTSCSSLRSFRSNRTNQTIPALPATTFDYSLMLDSYCHWNWEDSALIQDTYTDAQAQEVAKLCRYCGQSVEMDYSPEGSGAYTDKQKSAMKSTFGYPNATLISKSSGWYGGYSTTQWENILKTEIDAGRPILYSASDPQPNGGGHAFICDGYNSDGMFHFNLGWFGTCDGWYKTTALVMLHRDLTELNFSQDHQIVYKLEPSNYCIFNADDVTATNDGIIVLGETLNAQAINATFRTSYSSVNVVFELTDANGNKVCEGNNITLSKNGFTQGSTIDGTIVLPTTLESGDYFVDLSYYTSTSNIKTAAISTNPLHVAGHMAKFGSAFDIKDVTALIDMLLESDNPNLTIKDVTALIDVLLDNAE